MKSEKGEEEERRGNKIRCQNIYQLMEKFIFIFILFVHFFYNLLSRYFILLCFFLNHFISLLMKLFVGASVGV